MIDQAFSTLQRKPGTPRSKLWVSAQGLLPIHLREPADKAPYVPAWFREEIERKRVELRNRPSPSFPKPPIPTRDEPQESVKDDSGIQSKILSALCDIREQLVLLNRKLAKPGDVEEVTPEAKPKKPRVLMLGLLPGQEQEIRKDFDAIFDLRFTKDVGRIGDMAKNADHVVAMASKIGHSMQDAARSATDKYTPVPGGMSSLKGFLEDLWEQLETTGED